MYYIQGLSRVAVHFGDTKDQPTIGWFMSDVGYGIWDVECRLSGIRRVLSRSVVSVVPINVVYSSFYLQCQQSIGITFLKCIISIGSQQLCVLKTRYTCLIFPLIYGFLEECTTSRKLETTVT